MKLSELKEQIKELYLQEQNSVEDTQAQTKATQDQIKATQDLTAARKELNTVTMSEFKNYLRNEILAEIAEQEDEEEVSDDVEIETSDEEVELGDLDGEEEIEATIDKPVVDKALELDDIGDTLIRLARKAQDVDERELANQILNSAKFAKKTEFKKVEKDAGIGDEEA